MVFVNSFSLRVSRKENVNFVDKFQCPEAPGLNSLCKLLVLSLHARLVPLISLVMSSYAVVLSTTPCPGSQGFLRGE